MTMTIRAEDHLGLVNVTAMKFLHQGRKFQLEFDDLFQSGCEGLLKAINNFDKSRGHQFSTYAVPMIQWEIKRAIRAADNRLKVPRQLRELANQIKRLGLEDEPTEVIVEQLGMSEQHVQYALDAINTKAISLDHTFYYGGDRDLKLADTIAASQDFTSVHINDFESSLSERDQITLTMRLDGKTQHEIAEVTDVSQVQVSRDLKRIGNKYLEYSGEGVAI